MGEASPAQEQGRALAVDPLPFFRQFDGLHVEALRHVNWRRVAEELLDRLAPRRRLLAGYVSTPSVN